MSSRVVLSNKEVTRVVEGDDDGDEEDWVEESDIEVLSTDIGEHILQHSP